MQNKTGFEKGKTTLSKCGYIMLDRGFGRLRRGHGLEIGDSAETGDCGKNEVLIRVILSSATIRDQKGDK